MHLLTVFAHPIRTSYPGAVMDSFHEPFAAAGHSIDILDLHTEGFDPRFTEADHSHFWGGPSHPVSPTCTSGSRLLTGWRSSSPSTGGRCRR